jgi:hypothetical protein
MELQFLFFVFQTKAIKSYHLEFLATHNFVSKLKDFFEKANYQNKPINSISF